ncbi:CidA/LrgA family protein [Nitrincola tibetensis]|uniref:CidA/LrgA family protein n=1 Tax=Nitrincola tibetensis TaxID=2219697 RepID=A0A364NLE6_9GAMM|nr:CidA/LrgA family protein [Nitrincola tibetensis]RAU17871.1 CidA/LrgA family protein [Nitrincola tibetensis]
MLQGLFVLLFCQLLGELLMMAINAPIPGPVAGMLILLIGLMVLGRVPDGLRLTSTGLISHLSLLFIPAGVGLMVFADQIKQQWWIILVALLVSTFLTLIVVAWVMERFKSKEGQDHGAH